MQVNIWHTYVTLMAMVAHTSNDRTTASVGQSDWDFIGNKWLASVGDDIVVLDTDAKLWWFKWSIIPTEGWEPKSSGMLLEGVKDFVFDEHGFMILKNDGSLHQKADINSQPVKINHFIATDCTSMKMIDKDKVAIAQYTSKIVRLSILSLTGGQSKTLQCDITEQSKGNHI